jgi:UDP-N-acetylglucosamine/UDP-N-acetylgalactosamine diphosphorylase
VSSERPKSTDSDRLREAFERSGQGHVFRFWDGLDAEARLRLTDQLAGIDLAALRAAHKACGERESGGPRSIEPLAVECLPEYGGDPARFERARVQGERLLAAGRVACLVVAGGQASRLGIDVPKGAFALGPVSERSLFELQAQKIRGLRRRHGRPLPWYVMTSPATDAATRALFERHDRFGLPAEDVFFFQQATVASLDFGGRLLLEAPDRVFENPDGHGGSLTALLHSGGLDHMEARGVDTVFYYQVDNPLVRMADPVYLGFHVEAGAEMSCKVVRKQDPDEKVGVLAQADGLPGVVEYTELGDDQRLARDPETSELTFWAGNAAIHVFSTAFVRRVASDADRLLPFHASAKKIPALGAEGHPVTPDEPNGHKFERFVFDALPVADRVCVVEAARDREFSPVKNAAGNDSPATARRDLIAETRRWLDAAEISLPPSGTPIEVDHSRIDSPDDARSLGPRLLAEARDAVLFGPGVPS